MNRLIVDEIAKCFLASADTVTAASQKAYMRDQFEFLGLKTTLRRELQKKLFHAYPFEHEEGLLNVVEKLWQMEHREYQYCALELAKHHIKKISRNSISFFEKLIREKSWWDTVDDLAANIIGKLIGDDLLLMDSWINDSNLWIRRTALICQLKKKSKTDFERLFTYCTQTAHEKEFFIRKAIGWALREYSKAIRVR